VCSLKKSLLSIDRDLASESLKQGLGWIRDINQLSCILMSRVNRSSSFALISADEILIAWEELASSPSSSEISMAKENRLSGESCS